jgi:hypothetical protein
MATPGQALTEREILPARDKRIDGDRVGDRRIDRRACVSIWRVSLLASRRIAINDAICAVADALTAPRSALSANRAAGESS